MFDNTKANTLIIGDLKVKQWLNLKKERRKRRSQSMSTQNQGYLSNFIEFLVYECKLIGKGFIKIDESYTSKECCVCGTRH